MQTIIIVGNGIAAKSVIFYLTDSSLICPDKVRIIQIADESLAPACSLRSTSTLAIRGVRAGVSELGDQLIEAFGLWNEFYLDFKPEGMHPIKHISLGDNEGHFARRFAHLEKDSIMLNKQWTGVIESGYVLTPDILLNSIDQINQKRLKSYDYQFKKGFVSSIDRSEKKIVYANKEECSYDQLVLATGAYSCLFFPELEEYGKTKIREGTYWSFRGNIKDQFFKKYGPYCLNLLGMNLLYRPDVNEYVFGATTDDEQGLMAPNIEETQALFAKMSEHVRSFIDLPDFDSGNLSVGLRHQGPKRKPRTSHIPGDVFILDGAYKNGYMLSLVLAKDVVTSLRAQ